MQTFITVLFVFTALLLIAVILIQQPKSSGGGLFSGTGQSLLGTSGKTFWTKFTTILAVIFMGFCLILTALPRYQNQGSSVAESIEKQQQAAPAQPAAAPVSSSPQSPAPQSNPQPQAKPAAAATAPVKK
jgi:preprotein translocase subunit SecG